MLGLRKLHNQGYEANPAGNSVGLAQKGPGGEDSKGPQTRHESYKSQLNPIVYLLVLLLK